MYNIKRSYFGPNSQGVHVRDVSLYLFSVLVPRLSCPQCLSLAVWQVINESTSVNWVWEVGLSTLHTDAHTHTQTPSPSPTSPLSLQVPFSKRRYFCGLHAILRWSGVHLHTQEPGEDTNSRGATVCATSRGRPKHPFPWGGADTAEDNAPPGWEGEEGKWEEEKEHLLHISGYQGVNIICTEHWTHTYTCSWLDNVQKYVPFCSKNCGPILITLWSCEKRYQALSTHTCSRSVITLEQRGRMRRTRITITFRQ